jgi:hypothetical protein
MNIISERFEIVLFRNVKHPDILINSNNFNNFFDYLIEIFNLLLK